MNELGIGQQSCAKVIVNKDTPIPFIRSMGYNTSDCNSISSGKVERELKIDYDVSFSCNNIPEHAISCYPTGVNLTDNRDYQLMGDSFGSCTYQDDTCEAICEPPNSIIGNLCEEPAAVPTFIAVGGIENNLDGYKIHTFKGDGDFTVSSGSGTVDVLIIGGGGGGAGGGFLSWKAGGGGGGAVIEQSLTVSSGTYQIDVGGTAAGGTLGNNGTAGKLSSISKAGSVILSVAGGGGGGSNTSGLIGASGGGGGGPITTGGTGTIGFNGGAGAISAGGGGGGAGAVGVPATAYRGGNGGVGKTSYYSGNLLTYGGGGGGTGSTSYGNGGLGGGGNGNGSAGLLNTGGGGGAKYNGAGGAGGSGIVIIRYLTP